MKTENKKPIPEKGFDTVKTFRAIKDKISLEMANMNFEQIKEYLKKIVLNSTNNSTAHNQGVSVMGAGCCNIGCSSLLASASARR